MDNIKNSTNTQFFTLVLNIQCCSSRPHYVFMLLSSFILFHFIFSCCISIFFLSNTLSCLSWNKRCYRCIIYSLSMHFLGYIYSPLIQISKSGLSKSPLPCSVDNLATTKLVTRLPQLGCLCQQVLIIILNDVPTRRFL